MLASPGRELAVRYGLGLELMRMAGGDNNPSLDWAETMQALPSEDQVKIAVLIDEMTPIGFGMKKEARFIARILRGAGRAAREFMGLEARPVGRAVERAAAEEIPEAVLQRGEQAVLGTRPVAAPPTGPLRPEAQLGLFESRLPRAAPEIPVAPPSAEPFVVQRPLGAAGAVDYGVNVPTGTLAQAGAPAAAAPAAAARPVGPLTSWVERTGQKAWEAFRNQTPFQKAMTLFPAGLSAYQMAQGELPIGTGIAGMLLPFVGLSRGWKWKQIPIELGTLMMGPKIESALYGWQPRAEQIAQAQQQGFDVGSQQGMEAGLQQGSLMGYQQAASQMPQTPQIMPMMMDQQSPMPSPPSTIQPQTDQPDFWSTLSANPSVMARGGPAGLVHAWGQQRG